MTNIVNANKTGLVFGAFFGLMHLMWSLLVLAGWGQPLVDFVLWAHMMHLSVVIGPFALVSSAVLIVMTAVIGYLFGYVMGVLWNRIHGA